ncbi:hypothetical protein N7U66_18970 [Lacinutrix neustonica]|uniref:Uncharacterized protein n=1 Tax=Lacinutrix neustonica TaxID=2980107 RepID=A0A9E8SDM3_9FLAO|nr:hypothetical protein [Lacinutrix neustonica]WAC01907.1 hypothetical protein N7U66_18970 [Lacinutrix neustonica]
MNDSKQKPLDILSKKLFETQPLASPSGDFTAAVMKEVVKLSATKTIIVENTPLISKTVSAYNWCGIQWVVRVCRIWRSVKNRQLVSYMVYY